MPSVQTNGRPLFQAPIRRFIGRQGGSAPLDTCAAAALDLLEEKLGPGLPERPLEGPGPLPGPSPAPDAGKGVRSEREWLARILAMPIWDHSDAVVTLFGVLKRADDAGAERTPLPTSVDGLKLTAGLLAAGDSFDSRRSTRITITMHSISVKALIRRRL